MWPLKVSVIHRLTDIEAVDSLTAEDICQNTTVCRRHKTLVPNFTLCEYKITLTLVKVQERDFPFLTGTEYLF